MSKKKTHEEYVSELTVKNPIIKVIGKYIDAKTPILHYCMIHNVSWKTAPYRMLMGCGCEECRKDKYRNARCRTHEQYVQEVFNVNQNVQVVGQYIDAKTKILHRCKIHDVLWDALPDNILAGHGCWECGKYKIGEKNRKNHEQYKEEVRKINPFIEVIGLYVDANTPILHKCLIDNHEWTAQPANILYGKGCPKCAGNI